MTSRLSDGKANDGFSCLFWRGAFTPKFVVPLNIERPSFRGVHLNMRYWLVSRRSPNCLADAACLPPLSPPTSQTLPATVPAGPGTRHPAISEALNLFGIRNHYRTLYTCLATTTPITNTIHCFYDDYNLRTRHAPVPAPILYPSAIMIRQIPLRTAATVAPSRLLFRPSSSSFATTVTTRFLTTETTQQVSTPPPPSPATATPAAPAPAPAQPRQLSYLVERTASRNLSVYNDTRSGGSKKETVIKKIVGDIHALKSEITSELGFPRDTVKINPVTGHIKIKVG